MHAAPSVSYPVGRSRLAGALVAAAWGAGAAAVVAWSAEPVPWGWRQALAAAAVVLAGAIALRSWRAAPSGTLAWTGAGWQWRATGEPGAGEVQVALDLQSHLLVRWQPEAGPVLWLWLERSRAPLAWDALRRAVYSRARTGAPHGA